MDLIEQQQHCCGIANSSNEKLPNPSGHAYPMVLTYNQENQIFFTNHQHYHCHIPQLSGTAIRASFYDGSWLLLGKHPLPAPALFDFCLWNPFTSQLIHLPRLSLRSPQDTDDNYVHNYEYYNLKDTTNIKMNDEITMHYLSYPPDHSDSVLLVGRGLEATIFLCHLRNGTKRWTTISYANQVAKNVPNCSDGIIESMVCCNGDIYASDGCRSLARVDIKFMNDEPTVNAFACGELPNCRRHRFGNYLLAYNDKELYTIVECVQRYNSCKRTISLRLFKFDFSSMLWEELTSAKDRVFFLDAFGCNHFCCRAIEPKSGDCIHMIKDSHVNSYNITHKTMSVSCLPCPDIPSLTWTKKYVSTTWVMPDIKDGYYHNSDVKEQVDEEEASVQSSGSRLRNELEETTIETQGSLLDMPLHILELIADHCVATDYLNFRATCKHCQLAAPLCRLEKHSFVSSCLMLFDIDQGKFMFTDPMCSEKFIISAMPPTVGDTERIWHCRYGWLLTSNKLENLLFLNPFTRATIQLPSISPLYTIDFCSITFSASPMSSDCLVVALSADEELVRVTSPGASDWCDFLISSDFQANLPLHDTQTFFGKNRLYILCSKGEPTSYENIGTEEHSCDVTFISPPETYWTTSDVDFSLVECGSDLLLIAVREFGKYVEVFKLKHPTTQWEKVYDLGKYAIYVCQETSFSVVAKHPKMENKIYFPRRKGGNIVFYSLDTCTYHTCGGNVKDNEAAFTDFFCTQEQLLSLWIEPDWSY